MDAWRTLPFDQRLLFNKMLTGALRVGVSQRTVQQALAAMSGLDVARIAQRMLGDADLHLGKADVFRRAGIGLSFGWRTEFVALGLGVVLIGVLGHLYLPAVPGEPRTRGNSPLVLLKNPAILLVMLLTFLSVVAHYAVYTYISLLVETAAPAGGIGAALAIVGVGAVLSVVLSAWYIDAWLRPLIMAMLALGAVAMVLLLAFGGTPGVAHLAFFLWGISFGPLVTMYQAAVARQADRGRDVAASLQSSVFNFSIMVASWIGGVLLVRLADPGVRGIVWLALGCFVAAVVVTWRAKKVLR